MQYRYEATSLTGLVQQLAANILSNGYWFYVTGRVPDSKEPAAIDQKLIEKYGVSLSRQQRARRKRAGLANVHYLRWERFWVLLATHGEHRFFEEEKDQVRDARLVPIQIGGYSQSVKHGNFLKKSSADALPAPDGKYRVRVQIGRERYRELKAHFVGAACHRSAGKLTIELWNLPFERYAPIRKQLLNLLRLVNEKRQRAGFSKIPLSVLRYRREIVNVFAGLRPPLGRNQRTVG